MKKVFVFLACLLLLMACGDDATEPEAQPLTATIIQPTDTVVWGVPFVLTGETTWAVYQIWSAENETCREQKRCDYLRFGPFAPTAEQPTSVYVTLRGDEEIIVILTAMRDQKVAADSIIFAVPDTTAPEAAPRLDLTHLR